LDEAHAQEATYREQLARALTEAREAAADLTAARRHADDGAAQANHWRRAAGTAEEAHAHTRTQLTIARDEIALLEHDVQRARAENASLQGQLGRAERRLYQGLNGGSDRAPEPPAPRVARGPSMASRRSAGTETRRAARRQGPVVSAVAAHDTASSRARAAAAAARPPSPAGRFAYPVC